jgi:hypothetical protein
MTLIHGRRWRRVAILSSVTWFVGLAIVAWSDGIRSNIGFLRERFVACLEVLDRADHALQDIKPVDRDGKRLANWTKFKSCEASAEILFNQISDDQSNAVSLLLTVNFVTVLIGWLLVGLVVLVARWVSRGFALG